MPFRARLSRERARSSDGTGHALSLPADRSRRCCPVTEAAVGAPALAAVSFSVTHLCMRPPHRLRTMTFHPTSEDPALVSASDGTLFSCWVEQIQGRGLWVFMSTAKMHYVGP